jgi:hypothetical protein
MGGHCIGSEPTTKSLLTLNVGYSSSEYGSIAVAPWAGNLVVVNMTVRPDLGGVDQDFHHGVNLSDFRYAFDHLTRDNYIFDSPNPNPYFIRKEGRWFKAVKIYCSGDVQFGGKKKVY